MLGETFSRADATTCATYRDSSGIWQTVAANIKRSAHYHYDGTASYRTTLREAASTNSALGACSYASDSYWVGSASFTIATATSCIAGQTAYKHTANSQTRSQAIGTFVNGQADCASMIVENVDGLRSDIGIRDNTAAAWLVRARITWSSKAASITDGSGTAGVIDLGGGRYRLWVVGTGTGAGTGAAGNNRAVYIYPTNDGASSSVIIHHAQFEAASSYPSSPIVTVASAVTRAADVWSFSWPYAPQAMTVYVDAYDLMGTAGGSDRGIFSIGDSAVAAASFYGRKVTPTDLWRSQAKMASGSSVSTQAAASALGNRVELRAFLTVSGANVTTSLGQSINGSTETVSAAGTSQTLDATWASGARLYLGALGTGNYSNLAIRSIVAVLGPEQSMANLRLIARS